MKKEVSVSIIMPTWNRADYLAEALESCLKQDYKKYDIIVVDDGSTDSTPRLMEYFLKKYPDKIKYFKKENGGPASAMNYGCQKSDADVFMFAASDDVQLPEKISIGLEALGMNDFGYSGYHHANTKAEPWEYCPPLPFTLENIKECKGPSGGALVMWRKTWEATPFREELKVNEDLAWTIDAYKKDYKGGLVDKPTFLYRMLPDGMSFGRKKEVDTTTSELLKELE